MGFPLDTVKVRLQDPSIAEEYSRLSTFNSLVKIIREERIQGLYKGIVSPLVFFFFPYLVDLRFHITGSFSLVVL